MWGVSYVIFVNYCLACRSLLSLPADSRHPSTTCNFTHWDSISCSRWSEIWRPTETTVRHVGTRSKENKRKEMKRNMISRHYEAQWWQGMASGQFDVIASIGSVPYFIGQAWVTLWCWIWVCDHSTQRQKYVQLSWWPLNGMTNLYRVELLCDQSIQRQIYAKSICISTFLDSQFQLPTSLWPRSDHSLNGKLIVAVLVLGPNFPQSLPVLNPSHILRLTPSQHTSADTAY